MLYEVITWLIALGPEGGDAGGELNCEGSPEMVSAHATSHTGKALRDYREALEQLSGRSPSPQSYNFV